MACPGQPPDGEADIQVFEGVEPIRHRPAMYIGDTGARGLRSVLFNLVTESLAEVVAGRGNEVRVSLRADGSAEVSDDGEPMENVQFAFDRLDHTHGGRWGSLEPAERDTFAYVVANALSEQLTVVARTPGSIYTHSFRRGVTHAVLQSGGSPDAQGLTVTLRPDPDIFGTTQFDPAAVRERLRELAFLHSGVRFTFTDAIGTRDVFEYGDGIRELLEHLNAARTPLHDVLIFRGEDAGVRYEIGLQWCAEAGEGWQSFANGDRTPNGGTHESGVRAGVALGLRDVFAGAFKADDLRVGLTAVVSVWLNETQFLGATRSQLGNHEVEGVVRSAARCGVAAHFAAEPGDAAKVLKAVTAARDRREGK